MKITTNKDIIRNNDYNLSSIDLIIYLKLKEISISNSSLNIGIDQLSFKNSILINDNRTLKRSFINLYENGLVVNKIEKFNSKGNTEIILSDLENGISFQSEIFKHLPVVGHIGLHLALYLLSYYDNTENNYMEVINQKTISKRLHLNRETIVKYIAILKNNSELSYLTDELKYLGKVKYTEDYKIPNKRTITKKFLENKLENELVENLNIIENGMQYIGRQIEVLDGRMDILARDKNNNLCIIELKVIPDDEKLIFQCVYYPTQFNENVRMITIAPAYDPKIKTCLDVLNVDMKTYKYINNELVIE